MTDLRNRKWRKLRVVVEVSVPPLSRATEKDLRYAVENVLPDAFALPRPIRADAHISPVRVKTFGAFWPAFKLLQSRERKSNAR